MNIGLGVHGGGVKIYFTYMKHVGKVKGTLVGQGPVAVSPPPKVSHLGWLGGHVR